VAFVLLENDLFPSNEANEQPSKETQIHEEENLVPV
jgi:hypothetical protein